MPARRARAGLAPWTRRRAGRPLVDRVAGRRASSCVPGRRRDRHARQVARALAVGARVVRLDGGAIGVPARVHPRAGRPARDLCTFGGIAVLVGAAQLAAAAARRPARRHLRQHERLARVPATRSCSRAAAAARLGVGRRRRPDCPTARHRRGRRSSRRPATCSPRCRAATARALASEVAAYAHPVPPVAAPRCSSPGSSRSAGAATVGRSSARARVLADAGASGDGPAARAPALTRPRRLRAHARSNAHLERRTVAACASVRPRRETARRGSGPRLSSGSGRPCRGPRPGRRCRRPAPGVSSVSSTPRASRCRRATFSSRCFGST